MGGKAASSPALQALQGSQGYLWLRGSSVLSSVRTETPPAGQKAPQNHELPLSWRTQLPGSQGGLGSLGPISLRSFQSQFSAVFPRENSHLF